MGNLLPGIAGGLIGLAGVLLGAWIGSRSQDRRWVREQKLKAATEVTTAGMHLYQSQLEGATQRRHSTTDRMLWLDRLQAGRSQMHLLCSRETRDASDRLAELVWREEGTDTPADEAEVIKALQALTDSLRREFRT
ncbi:hypothetical protein [Cryptosporangium sp. NPDC048952]|uniref:hypothetical protein n=1 Tax=Cryptosporangium sp. NPDC048952 TaxID=3363961 RepID=UPI003718E1D2